MAEFWCRLVAPHKWHCLANLMLYVHICHIFDGLYVNWRVKAMLHYHFKMLDRKPRPQSQSYIGPTIEETFSQISTGTLEFIFKNNC